MLEIIYTIYTLTTYILFPYIYYNTNGYCSDGDFLINFVNLNLFDISLTIFTTIYVSKFDLSSRAIQTILLIYMLLCVMVNIFNIILIYQNFSCLEANNILYYTFGKTFMFFYVLFFKYFNKLTDNQKEFFYMILSIFCLYFLYYLDKIVVNDKYMYITIKNDVNKHLN